MQYKVTGELLIIEKNKRGIVDYWKN